tara:strand:+ start:448 stop:837 length:390 start_codon:yes stop_codon:yes gene_type:complete
MTKNNNNETATAFATEDDKSGCTVHSRTPEIETDTLNNKNKKINRPPKQCPYCCKNFSYYNYASHEKRCKVKLNQNISITNNEIDTLRKDNQKLKFENELWEAKYNEIKAINDKLLSKFPRITERVTLD